MNIKILSRVKAVKLSYTDFEGDKIIISISDPFNEPAHFNKNNNSIKEILYLSMTLARNQKISLMDTRLWYQKMLKKLRLLSTSGKTKLMKYGFIVSAEYREAQELLWQ